MNVGLQSQPYYFGADGALDMSWKLNDNTGWIKAVDGWRYVRNGKMLEDGMYMINGKYYAFFTNGAMRTDEIFSLNNSYYYAGKDGVIVTSVGWYETDLGWVYVKNSSGELCRSCRYTIGSTIYKFGTDCYWIR